TTVSTESRTAGSRTRGRVPAVALPAADTVPSKSPGGFLLPATGTFVPTVYFDLSSGVVETVGNERCSQLCQPDRSEDAANLVARPASSTSSRGYLAADGSNGTCGLVHRAPSVSEHYGALLSREERAREQSEEHFRAALEDLRRAQHEMQQREWEFEQEKAQLMRVIDEKDDLIEMERARVEVCIAEEREAAREQHWRLKERVRQLTMFQKSLLKQVSTLVAEREELKRLVARGSAGVSRRFTPAGSCGSISTVDRVFLLAEGGASSSSLVVCGAAPGAAGAAATNSAPADNGLVASPQAGEGNLAQVFRVIDETPYRGSSAASSPVGNSPVYLGDAYSSGGCMAAASAHQSRQPQRRYSGPSVPAAGMCLSRSSPQLRRSGSSGAVTCRSSRGPVAP
ncbi:unnamed protein product, partial [Polarella glacialis]